MYQNFLRSVLPAMLAFAFSGLYTIVDGFFIGRSIGDVGLASINIAYPMCAFIQAVGTGIGMGGAIQISLFRGKGNKKEEQKYLGNTIGLLFVAGVAITLLLLILSKPILIICGAEGNILKEALAYIKIIAIGALFQLTSTGFMPLLRNYDKSLHAMMAMVAGFLTNIVLDWLFISKFQYGMAGAALATIIGQAVTLLPCLLFLMKKGKDLTRSCYLWTLPTILTILKVAVSPFGLTISPFIVVILINKWAVTYGGETAVAAYAVISYITSVILLLLHGISDGNQPLLSLNAGKGEEKNVKTLRRLAYGFSIMVAIIAGVLILLLRNTLPIIFGSSKETSIIVVKSLPFFVIGFLFVAFCRVTTSYFYATQKNLFAYIMVYGEPVILAILLLFLLPNLFALEGVWMSIPTSQFLLAVIGFLLLRIEKKYLQYVALNHKQKCSSHPQAFSKD